MTGDRPDEGRPYWQLGNYQIHPVDSDVDQPSDVPWRAIIAVTAIMLALAAVGYVVITAV